MISVIHCLDCGRYSAEDDLETKVVDLEEEYGVGGLFPDHHRKKIEVCPECGSSSLEEESFDEWELADLLNELAEQKKR